MTPKAARCIAFLHELERGMSPDGTTNFGWDQRYNPDIKVMDLTEEQSAARYFQRYWEKYRLEELPEALAMTVLQFFVNSGAGPEIYSHLDQHKPDFQPSPEAVLRAQGHYMMDLACGFVSRKPDKLVYWTDALPGWARRIQKTLRAVRALEGEA